MEDNKNFCVNCGAQLSDTDKFCSACGARVPGRNPEQVAEEKDTIRTALNMRLKWPIIMMLLYAIPFLIFGIALLYNSDFLVETIMDNQVDGMELTEDLVRDGVQFLAIAYLISSVSAIVSSICCYKAKYFWVAVVTCFISIFTGIAGIFALFMGLFALLEIFTSKLAFEEYRDQLESKLDAIQ